MKLTSLLFATAALLFISPFSQAHQEEAEVTETFVTAALINPNTAGADVITSIPGVDAELAQQVISGRPYATPSALNAVLKDAVDENELKTIYSAMFVKVDLNTGSNADYQLIPSTLSARHLAHEFEEYRPYSSLEQFSREMSKYVSAQEVAFLRRYVVID